MSRPTFYKYFSSAVDVIDEVVRQCNQEVEQLFVRIFEQPQKEFYDYLPMALSGYLNWGRSQGLLMEARFRELHDRSSPVSRYRDEHNRRIASTLHGSMVRHGRTPPDDLALTSLVQGIEHLAFHMSGPTDLMLAGSRMIKKGYESFWGPGRHKFGSNWFWYFNSPLGTHVEYDADMDLHDGDWIHREGPMGPEQAQMFLFENVEKWAPGGPPPGKGPKPE